MRYLALLALYVAVTAYCVTEVVNFRDKHPHGLPKALWIAVIVLVPYLGAAAWILMGFRRRGGRPVRPASPDDDPEYLRYLRDQERLRRRRDGV